MIQDPTLWIGEVPEHWELLKGKELFVQVKRGLRDDDGTVTAFRDGVVTLRSNRRTTGFTEAVQFSGYQGVEPGDLVIHQMDGFAGAIGVSDSRGRCSPVCAVSVPRDTANTYYYARVLRAMAVSGWIAALAKGIRERSTDFRFSVFRDQMLPVPPEEEQALIVRYLDHAELRIAKAIAGKNEVLSKLREAKTAVVSELVLGDVEDRTDTGVPGFGSVPSHWRRRRAKYVWRAVDVRSTTGTEERLTVSSARGIVPRSSTTVTMFEAASYIGHKVVEPGNLVINSLWSWATGLGVSKHHGIVSPVYGVYTIIDDQCDVAYLDHLLRSNACQWQFQVRSKGIWKSRLSLTDEAFLDMMLVLPPLEEQREIAHRIGERTSAIDAAMDAVNAEIALLKEYRTRLISDVVTGKIDIREEAAKLTDIDPAELARVLAGGTALVDEEEAADDNE